MNRVLVPQFNLSRWRLSATKIKNEWTLLARKARSPRGGLRHSGQERERFEREIEWLMAFPVRVLLVEASWGDIELGQWRSKLTPKQVEGSLVGWAARGIQVELVGSHERAGRFVSRLFYTIARRRYKELRSLVHAASK